MLGGKGKGGRVGQRESPSGTEVSPCLRVANLQKIFFLYYLVLFGLQPEPEPEAAAAICYHYQCSHVRVGLCGIYMCAEIQNDSKSHDR
jgi:hypothetical protein